MRIQLTLPDWAFELRVYLLSGIELAAYKDAEACWWKVKTRRCRMCGDCCVSYNNCGHLMTKDGKRICAIGLERPFFCSMWYDDDDRCNQYFEARTGGWPDVDLEVEDWAGERDLYILSALELVAYRLLGNNWQVKTARCSYCGDCCSAKQCDHLKPHPRGRQCDLGLGMPIQCCIVADGGPRCTQRFKEVTLCQSQSTSAASTATPAPTVDRRTDWRP